MHVYAMCRWPPCVYDSCWNSDSRWYSGSPTRAARITATCARDATPFTWRIRSISSGVLTTRRRAIAENTVLWSSVHAERPSNVAGVASAPESALTPRSVHTRLGLLAATNVGSSSTKRHSSTP
eukprot:Amastigsp_a681109_78.p5 type:complete len:124 gc:universal Amastigsp_a681109_78:750-1121(+)